ncbi:universal stress protein [uncultured Winogradskyella sp.]|uniref:universal stress protein n=1 Tax=uncultured Winogradskyella sp. TaxID=395353 RepID=UPI002635456A|nr:universal stress protein [uncultured Winogradskyella sp.]
MKNGTYKILVLSDLKASTTELLKSTASFANMIDGEVHLFHVKKGTEIVKTASQLSAKREINEYNINADKNIKNLIKPISKQYNLDIKYRFSLGNVKDEIDKHIKQVNPDVIVLGKRKSKPLKLIGDNVTNFILKRFNKAVMIVSDDNNLGPDADLSIGLLNGTNAALTEGLSGNLIRNTKRPLTSFKVGSQSKETIVSENKVVEFVFEENDNTINTLSDYISKKKVNLLCIDRNTTSKKDNYTNAVINKVNVSLLVT